MPSTVLSDPTRIQQILLNLLSNAIKFTESGIITVELGTQDERLIFRVTDTGIGMSGEELSRVFTPFEQADGSTTRKFGGTGLGLAIVKRIVELMHGEITVTSAPGQGTTFEVLLPLTRANLHTPDSTASTTEPPAGGQSPLRGIRILVAEDNEINREILVSNLEFDGASVVAVNDGKAAVDRVLQEGAGAFDIVLMDIQMPEMNGHEATRAILERYPDLPVLGQTAHAFADEIEACLASGMVGHIAKPIDLNELPQTILQFVKKR